MEMLKEWKCTKRVTHMVYEELTDILYFADKHGSVFSIKEFRKEHKAEPEYITQNMDSILTFEKVDLPDNSGKKCIFAVDLYAKIKVFKVPEIYEI